MTITATLDAEALIVRLEGEVDLLTAQRLRDFLLANVGVNARGEIHLDMARVSFFGAAGATVLADASEAAQHHGTTLLVRRPSRCVARVLTILGMIDGELVVPAFETNAPRREATYEIGLPR